MTTPSKPSGRAPVAAEPRVSPAGVVFVAWLVPGAGHAMLGQTRRAAVLFAVLTFMFIVGLGFGGRLFPFATGEPLVFLAAVAEWALGMPRVAAAVLGLGAGDVVAVTYEYGNTFLIAGGLLNMLVMLDARDRATGQKP